MEIAISYLNVNRVSLWASIIEEHENGRIDFNVINGSWSGSIANDIVFVNETKTEFPGKVVWRGEAPFTSYKFNEAIDWIEEQLLNNEERIAREEIK